MTVPSSIIAKRMIQQVLVIALLLIIGFAFFVGFFTYSREVEAFEEKFGLIERGYLDVIESALWVDDRENLRITLMSICRIPGIEFAAIESQKKVVCKAGETAVDKKLHRVFPIHHEYNGKPLLLGELHVKGSLAYVRGQALKAALLIMAAQASIILLVCIIILMLLYHAVVRRILTITSYTSSVSLKDLDTELLLPPRDDRPDEVDDLADTINRMRENLRQAFIRKDEIEKELRLYQEDLETMVTRRTAALEKANETLQGEIARRARMETEREKLIRDLQNALSEVKKLGGMLPICSHCKKIRDDRGYWSQVEAYIQLHSEAQFSHSICPECAEKYYAEYHLYGES